MNLPSDGLAPAYRWFAAYSIRCPIDQTRRSQGEARSRLHSANSEFPAEATSLLDHEIGPACADYSSARPIHPRRAHRESSRRLRRCVNPGPVVDGSSVLTSEFLIS